MKLRELGQIPNLLSLSRIFLTPFIAYYLWRGDNQAALIALFLIIVAGVTDGLDGYMARKLNQITELGLMLDPLADKIMAAILAVCLILFRDFPIWLAAVIIGRDILILIVGLTLLRGRKLIVPSNETGKYAFASIAVLIGSYIIWFPFGIQSMTIISLLLLFASSVNYARVFWDVYHGKEIRPVVDTRKKLIQRQIPTVIFEIYFLYQLYLYFPTLLQ